MVKPPTAIPVAKALSHLPIIADPSPLRLIGPTVSMKNVEVGIGDLNARVDTLAKEVRQRFRFRGA